MIKALLIESDPKTRDVIRAGLEQLPDFELEHADGAWGADLVEEQRPDVVFVNLELKDREDGMEVAKRIRADHPDIEIVLVTRGRSSRLLGKERAAASVFALLSLPVDEQAFFKLVTRLRERLTR